jgi:translation initiation factor eIF-2B subunit beta
VFEPELLPLASPAAVLPFEEMASLEVVNVDNAALDHVAPELVSLLLTNYGGYNPSYVYRLLRDLYELEE